MKEVFAKIVEEVYHFEVHKEEDEFSSIYELKEGEFIKIERKVLYESLV